jgi:arylsulfatase A-like enzyme
MNQTPNVLFLVVDSLRYDAVFGDESYDTPTLDRLADESVVFDNCYSQGISTAPAMTAMLTGRYPLEYGGHWYIEDEQPTFAEQFHENGYTTGAIHSNPNVSRLRNFDKGFDTFEENILPFESDGLLERAPDDLLRYANKFVRLLQRTPYMPSPRVNDRLAAWAEAAPEPWFLWTQYMDVHGPYLPGGEFTYRNKFRAEQLWRKAAVNSPHEVTPAEHGELQTNYRKEVEYFDAELGRFLARLDWRGELENTLVVVVGDHGDEFYEHDDYGHSNLPYDELTRVPLLMSFPDGTDIDQPQRVKDLVRCVDILPTALAFAETDYTEEMERRVVGESLLPLLREGSQPSFDAVVTEKEIRGETALRFGFRTDRWKFLYDGKADRKLLYDLDSDPNETENVADSHPDVMEEFEEHLDARLEEIERTSADIHIPDIESQPGVEERLQALGYQE